MGILGWIGLGGGKEASSVEEDEKRMARIENRRVAAIMDLKSKIVVFVVASTRKDVEPGSKEDSYEKAEMALRIVMGLEQYVPIQYRSKYSSYTHTIRKVLDRMGQPEADIKDDARAIEVYVDKLIALENEITSIESGFIDAAKRRIEYIQDAKMKWGNLMGSVSMYRDPTKIIPRERIEGHFNTIRLAIERATSRIQVRAELSHKVNEIYKPLLGSLPPLDNASLYDIQAAYDTFKAAAEDIIDFEEHLIRIESERILEEQRIERGEQRAA